MFNDSTNETIEPGTLGAFVNESLKISADQKTLERLKIQSLTRQQRSDKLTKIYRSILTLEPDTTVRAQIQHRMVQLDIKQHKKNETLENKKVLLSLVSQYKKLLITYPNRPENELIHYQLAKTYDFLGKSKQSIITIETLLNNYPKTKHYVELQFRRAELYYNLQQYPLAYKAYQAVILADNNESYRLNSLYMSGWSLFKLNRLPEADVNFIDVLNLIVEANYPKTVIERANFRFDQVPLSQKSLAMDTQRVLSISLSQQQQAKSLVKLLNRQASKISVTSIFDHVLFDNLANFLLEKKLNHDAVLTYKTYLDYSPHSIWAVKFSLALLDLYESKKQFSKIRRLKDQFANRFGLHSKFWNDATEQEASYALPKLLAFSLSKSRRLYGYAQNVESDDERQVAFTETANWLEKYLNLVTYSNDNNYVHQGQKTNKNNLATQEYYLYADANFESGRYDKALKIYEMLAYSPIYINQQPTVQFNINEQTNIDALSVATIRKESAYATIFTMNALLSQFKANDTTGVKSREIKIKHDILLTQSQELTNLFLTYYSDDKRAKLIAVKAAEYAFIHNNLKDVIQYADFVLNAYEIPTTSANHQHILSLNLDKVALKQIAIVSQLKANLRYELNQFEQAEKDYLLALNFVHDKQTKNNMSELVASSIYEQAKAYKLLDMGNINKLSIENPKELAIKHFLRLGKVVPDSKYRANAEFDAANLLMDEKQWARAINVLKTFKQQFPNHKYTASIPAKLALSYENQGDWSQAAKQLLFVAINESDVNVKREAQYTAAEYYLKVNDLDNAITSFRTYAHQYPKPFGIAQEVRFKLSEFYRQTKEQSKRYFWYRKIISFHNNQTKTSSDDLARSTYLSSYAAFYLGQAHQQTFNKTKLKAPLNKSLQRKQAAMKESIRYYQLVFKWKLAEFVPQANYSIGEIYRNLAADVMKSERPDDLDELALEEYEYLLEEIAYPFEEKAIEVHQANTERAWNDIYDQWVEKSLSVLADLDPAKYNKQERVPEVFDAIF